jgi:large subunit ribosomal protein L3
MLKALIGKKVRMTALYDESGKVTPLTALQLGPCPIVQVKTAEKDQYTALQLAYQPETKPKRVRKPKKGHFERAGVGTHRFLREVRVDDVSEYETGQVLDVSLFKAGDILNVTGTSKGRGFSGGVRRHGWHGGRKTHGSMFHRAPGAIGMAAYPSRVLKGKTLPGQYGNTRVTVRNLEVVQVDVENHLLYVKGAVPGPNGGFVEVSPATKQAKQ